MRRFLSWLLMLALLACSANAQDVSKINRAIAKEPCYTTKAPWYCLLLFGPEAKAKVWLVLDGDKLNIDRNGNGDLTEPGECVTRAPGEDDFRVPELGLKEGKSKYSNLRVNWRPEGVSSAGHHLHVSVQIGDHDQYATVFAKADRPAKATLIHFDGPLKPFFQIEPFKRQDHFTRGKEHLLGVSLVTTYPGVEWVQVSHDKGIPVDVHPAVEIAFPGKAPGVKPTTLTVQLKHRC
jgi:hypothetical protein